MKKQYKILVCEKNAEKYKKELRPGDCINIGGQVLHFEDYFEEGNKTKFRFWF